MTHMIDLLTFIDYENPGDINRPFFGEYKKVFAETLEGGWFILGKNVDRYGQRGDE